MKFKNRHSILAFTLAEVLITLGIIGVVAAMTIPTLLSNINDMQYKSAYKKAYATLTQAFNQALLDKEIVPLAGVNSSQGGETNFGVIKKYFSVLKDCSSSNGTECWDENGESFRGSAGNTLASPGFMDKSGMAYRLRAPDLGGAWVYILVDTNGFKGPNKMGYDRFAFTFQNASKVIGSFSGDDMGIPTKIVPYIDVTGTDPNSLSSCPSAATHPCYFTSWLFE